MSVTEHPLVRYQVCSEVRNKIVSLKPTKYSNSIEKITFFHCNECLQFYQFWSPQLHVHDTYITFKECLQFA